MADAAGFANPPVVEVVYGVQFSPLTKLTAGHFGLFWQALGEGWGEPADAPVLDDQFETFDDARPPWPGPPELRLEPARFPQRFILHHVGGDRLVQLQATRFHLNWRKGGAPYPRYERLVAEFDGLYQRLQAFTLANGLGEVLPNQWELTYVNVLPHGEGWGTLDDWPRVLPGLFGSLQPATGLKLDRRAAEWSFEIAPKQGRLHVAARPQRSVKTGRDELFLQMTARGPVEPEAAGTPRAGLDLGHSALVETLNNISSTEAKARWGEGQDVDGDTTGT